MATEKASATVNVDEMTGMIVIATDHLVKIAGTAIAGEETEITVETGIGGMTGAVMTENDTIGNGTSESAEAEAEEAEEEEEGEGKMMGQRLSRWVEEVTHLDHPGGEEDMRTNSPPQ